MVDKKISSLKTRLDRLLELLLDNTIEKSEYDPKRNDLLDELEISEQEQGELLFAIKNDKQLKKRLAEFKAVLEQNEAMNEFDPVVFESMIEKIIIVSVKCVPTCTGAKKCSIVKRHKSQCII